MSTQSHAWRIHRAIKSLIAFHDIHHVTVVLALSDPVRRRLHLLIILVKKIYLQLYSSKHLQKKLSLDELVNIN